ncbi:MAG: T9SS type A sorting domain-containing protein [Bacteroidales bacterium]|nr:T9SS type A sorting domain-containing protein [Bacteroidales bacterium]
MKRFLLSAIAIFAMTLCSFAQSIVCTDNACTPITDQPFSNTSVPYYCPQSLTFQQGQSVDVCITIKCPETTNVTISMYGASIPATANIESLTITDFPNMPESLSYCVSRVDMDPTTNVYATIHITGTAPSENGNIDLELSGVFTGSITSPMPYSLNNQAVTFATGIVITIGEGDVDPQTPEIVCENPCPAVTNQTMSETTIPYYAPEELTYNVNEDVDVCITIQCPETVNVEYMGMQANATTSSMTITGFTNIPDGLSYCVSRTEIDPTTNNFATVHLTGTPTTANVFDLNISCEVTGTATIAGMGSMPLNNFAITFPTGIVVTIEEQTSNAVVANFTSNPTATQLLGGSVIYITAGETITYTNASENATSIEWTFEGGNPNTSTENNVEVTYATAGNYTTTLTAYGENNTESTKTVGVNVSEPQPQNEVLADFTTNPEATEGTILISSGETITFTNTSLNAHHIVWTFPDGNPESSNENVVTVEYLDLNHTADYTTTATLTAYNEDESESDTKTIPIYVIVIYDNVDESAISEINVYPNPTSSVINIATEGMQNITIIDMTGRVVMSKDVNSNFETISAEGFAKANYMVRIATADGVVVKNIVVE